MVTTKQDFPGREFLLFVQSWQRAHTSQRCMLKADRMQSKAYLLHSNSARAQVGHYNPYFTHTDELAKCSMHGLWEAESRLTHDGLVRKLSLLFGCFFTLLSPIASSSIWSDKKHFLMFACSAQPDVA